jgi:hypothetical protein
MKIMTHAVEKEWLQKLYEYRSILLLLLIISSRMASIILSVFYPPVSLAMF